VTPVEEWASITFQPERKMITKERQLFVFNGHRQSELEVSKSVKCEVLPFCALTLLVGDRKDIRPVKSWVLVCWW